MKTKLLTLFLLLVLTGSVKAQITYNLAGEFNGTSSYSAVVNHSEIKPTDRITIEAWIKTTSLNTQTIYGQAISNGAVPYFGVASSGKLIFVLNGTSLVGKRSIPSNTWTHVAAVYTGSQKQIYINGVYDTASATTGSIAHNSDSTFIGASLSGGLMSNFFKGQMDNVRLWNIAKTQTQIANDMYVPIANRKPSGYYSGLVAAWRFDIPGPFAYDDGGEIGNSAYNRNIASVSFANQVPPYYDYNNNLVLKGANDYCSVPSNTKLEATSAVTLEAWVKRDTIGGPEYQEIVGKIGPGRYDYRLFIKNTGEIYFAVNDGVRSISTTPLVTTSQWTHIAAAYNVSNGHMNLYVNGDSAYFSPTSPVTINNNPDSLYIGGTGFSAQKFKGQIDEVRIWKNVYRTREQIRRNMYKNINFYTLPQEPSLALFNFDGRVDDSGTEGMVGYNTTLQFRGGARMNYSSKFSDELASPILRDDQGDFMGNSYNFSTKRFFIPNGSPVGAEDSIYFASSGNVSNMKIFLLLSTASANHVAISLTAPNGVSVILTPDPHIGNGDNMGVSGVNDIMTIFDGTADSTITYDLNSRLAPFSPKIKPKNSLSAFNGLSRQGWWKLKVIDLYNYDQSYVHGWGLQTSTLTSNDPITTTPGKFDLSQNYPNPFNPVTKINFSLPKNGIAKLKVFDVTGKEVAVLMNEVKTAGAYEVQFDGSKLSSGVYFYKLETDGFVETKKMLLVK